MTEVNELSGTAVVTRNDGLLTAEVDGELMAMSVEKGICYGLNAVGTRIWALIAEPRTVEELCALLVSEYEVDPAQCRSEVLGLLEDMSAEGLATIQAG
jgi:hypothetical protein